MKAATSNKGEQHTSSIHMNNNNKSNQHLGGGGGGEELRVGVIAGSLTPTSHIHANDNGGKSAIRTPTPPLTANNIDYSSIRGKNVLVSPTEEQFDLLRKRLEERTRDNRGETIYEIGVGEDGGENGLDDDEYAASVATLQSLVTTIDADLVLLRKRKVEKGNTAQYLIRKRVDTSDFMEIRIAVVGNVDAGKSTLLGVLTHGELDNGRGHARQRLFRHKHEMESGRTSSVGNDILGFDSVGNVVNKPDHGTLDWVKICEKSAKVITFIDLAGHERYLKTTVFGMTGHVPDFGMLMIGANAGIVGMTKEHLGLALALSVPVFVVVTKIDMCPVNILQDNLKLLFKILKSQGCRKVPVMVKTADEVVLSATNFVSERLCPIFQVSNVTGENLDLLKMFLNLLTTRMPSQDNLPAEFQIDDTYSVPGVGTVVSGTCLQGLIRLNDVLMLGPDRLGNFVTIAVKSIHRKRMNVKEVRGGQTASFALKKIKRSQIRKGMVMVSPDLKPKACWEFEGEILVLHHPTTISSRYQAMVHCGSIRQTASIVTMSKECLRTGDKAHVKFRFIKHPEYIRPGQRLVFREGRTKAVGNVIAPLTATNSSSSSLSSSSSAMATSAQFRPKPNKMQTRTHGQGSNSGQHHHHHHSHHHQQQQQQHSHSHPEMMNGLNNRNHLNEMGKKTPVSSSSTSSTIVMETTASVVNPPAEKIPIKRGGRKRTGGNIASSTMVTNNNNNNNSNSNDSGVLMVQQSTTKAEVSPATVPAAAHIAAKVQ